MTHTIKQQHYPDIEIDASEEDIVQFWQDSPISVEQDVTQIERSSLPSLLRVLHQFSGPMEEVEISGIANFKDPDFWSRHELEARRDMNKFLTAGKRYAARVEPYDDCVMITNDAGGKHEFSFGRITEFFKVIPTPTSQPEGESAKQQPEVKEQVPEADVRESDVLKAVISLKIKLVSLCQYDAAADVRHIEKLLRAIPALPDNKAEVDGWVRVEHREDRLPEINEQVEVVTEYESSGKTMNDRFIGFMADDGELVVCGSDDSYGWDFVECVKMYRRLPPLPPVPSPASPSIEVTENEYERGYAKGYEDASFEAIKEVQQNYKPNDHSPF